MAATLTISTPVLLPGEYFVVRYRPISGGSWYDVSPNPTNAPFVLPVTEGKYEVEVRAFVNGSLCPPVYYEVEPQAAECACPENVDAQLVRNTTGQVSLRVSYDSIPPCGFTLTYGPGSTPGGGASNYQTIPLIPPPGSAAMAFPVPGDDYDVILYVNCCEGPPVRCFEKRIVAPSAPPPANCTPYGLPETTHIVRLEYVGGIWHIKIVRKVPPDPAAPTQCGQIQIWARQQVRSGAPQDSVTVTLLDSDFAFQTDAPNDTAYFPVNPDPAAATYGPNGGDHGLIYYGTLITDCCRVGWQYLGMTDAYENTPGYPHWGEVTNPA